MFSRSQSCRGKSQSPVAWMAGGGKPNIMKPIDKPIFGMGSESPGRNESERTGGPESENTRGPSPLRPGEGSRVAARWLTRLLDSGGVVGAAR